MSKVAVLVSSIAMLATGAPAQAALLQFTLSGPETTGTPTQFASFQIDSAPSVDKINVAPGTAFALAAIPGVFRNGAVTRTTPQPINFFNISQRGGLVVGIDFFLIFDGPQLYSGLEANPVFKTGNFQLTDINSGALVSLTVAKVAAVPEPTTWAMMLVGFGMVAGAARYRRRSTRATYA